MSLPRLYGMDLNDAVKRIEKVLKPRLGEFDMVLGTGLSGTIPAAVFCHKYGKQMVVLRKENEEAHGSRLTSYEIQDKEDSRHIVIDDCVDTGKTMRRLLSIVPGRWPIYIVLYTDFNGRSILLDGAGVLLERVVPHLYRVKESS